MSFWEYVDDRRRQLLMDACRRVGTVFPRAVLAAPLGMVIAFAASGPGLGSPDRADVLDQVPAGTLGIIALSLLFDAGHLLLGPLTAPGRRTAPAQPEERRM
ncbi:hypothetical protein ACWDR2_11250 [Streptomyces sp. NPDC003631]|uniref:Uncharacterized protein n=1 Tax=Streptomyces lannensis TaxID=766498 RepID=A0ABP7JQA0_9ACTN